MKPKQLPTRKFSCGLWIIVQWARGILLGGGVGVRKYISYANALLSHQCQSERARRPLKSIDNFKVLSFYMCGLCQRTRYIRFRVTVIYFEGGTLDMSENITILMDSKKREKRGSEAIFSSKMIFLWRHYMHAIHFRNFRNCMSKSTPK